ncbi:MAG: mechanosensitive ion channel family protein [Caldilineaceae bacterium]|nr:mechanosensitive ion channel family protein [Caldilineaceae bacterium]
MMNDTTVTLNADPSNILETVNKMVNGFLALLPNLIIALVILVLFYFLGRILRNLIGRVTANRAAANVGIVLGRLTQWLTLFLGLLVALAIVAPSVQPVDILGALGVGGVAIGFAFRDILQNFLAGLLILLRQPFRIGDQIVVGDYEGTVEEIETRATMIKTYDGRRVVIPNGDIYTSSVVVNTAYETRRSQYDVGIGYGDDIAQAKAIMLQAMQNCEGVATEPAPDVLTAELAGASVNLRARWWTHSSRADVVQVSDRVITAIKNDLSEAGIDLPFPTQVILWHDQTEETDGDRTRQREGWPAGDNPPKARPISRALSQLNGKQGN